MKKSFSRRQILAQFAAAPILSAIGYEAYELPRSPNDALMEVCLSASYSRIVYLSSVDPSTIVLFVAALIVIAAGYAAFVKQQIAMAIGSIVGLSLSVAAFAILLWGA